MDGRLDGCGVRVAERATDPMCLWHHAAKFKSYTQNRTTNLINEETVYCRRYIYLICVAVDGNNNAQTDAEQTEHRYKKRYKSVTIVI